jgi:AcrR family transcriptional regulator
VAAGRTVFAERGFDASMDDVAHYAGVGVGTAYRHFSNKYELAAAIFAEAIEEVVVEAEKASVADDAWSGLVEFFEAIATRQTADRGLREVLMAGFPSEEDASDQIDERINAPLRIAVARAKAQGTMRTDAEMSDVGVLLTMLCTVADLTADVAPEQWRRYQPVLLAGLRPGGPDLPVPPLDEAELQTAMRTRQRRMRTTG